MGSYNKERYEYCKLNGICTACKKRPASLGRLKCEECARSDRECHKRKRENCKANGICTICMKRPAFPGGTECEECVEWHRRRNEDCRANGICINCRKRPVFPGRAECEECIERYIRRGEDCKAKGICTRCKKRPASPSRAECEECIEYEKKKRKERYKFYKSLGICTVCRKFTAVPGKTYCEVCRADSLEREEKRYSNEEKRKQILAKDRERYYQRKAKGECPGCGKPTEGGFTFCPGCRKKQRIRDKIRREEREGLARSELPDYGICFRCCKNPVMEGKRLCAACYGTTVRTLEIARNSGNAKKQMEYFKSLDYSGRMSYTV